MGLAIVPNATVNVFPPSSRTTTLYTSDGKAVSVQIVNDERRLAVQDKTLMGALAEIYEVLDNIREILANQ